MVVLGDSSYGEVYADIYDALFDERDDVQQVANVLEPLAQGGPILEFGIGTGRLALPLVRRGLKVYGVDNSEAMLARLRAKPDADRIGTVLGDFATSHIDEQFGLVAILFSTLYLIHSQEGQVEVFRNAARHLRPGGVFVVETFVHDRSRWNGTQETVTTEVTEDHVMLRAGQLDPVSQIITMQQVTLSAQGVTLRPNKLRFIHPSELDLMARLAGFRLRARWGDWAQSRFTASSGTQIVVYEKMSDQPLS